MTDARDNIEGSAAPSEDRPGLPTKILIAEDEHLLAASLADQLREMSIQVIGPASDGEKALELARTHMPDIALLDIRMPKIDGLSVAEAIFSELGIPAMLVSAYSDEQSVARSVKAGVFGYLVKPITRDELRVGLTVAWARYREQKSLAGQVEELKVALENRKLVERAKGILMDRLRLGEAEAMKRLQKQARDARRTLADMSRAIIESKQLFDEKK